MEVTVSFCLNPQGVRGYRRVVIFDGKICQVLAEEKFADRVSSVHPFFTTASPVSLPAKASQSQLRRHAIVKKCNLIDISGRRPLLTRYNAGLP